MEASDRLRDKYRKITLTKEFCAQPLRLDQKTELEKDIE